MSFRTIGLVGRQDNPLVADTLARLLQLLATRELDTCVETGTAGYLAGMGVLPAVAGDPASLSAALSPYGARTLDRAALAQTCDLVVVVGGDGSMLGIARELAASEVPVLGINRGSLGFLADISPDELEARVAAVLEGHYRLDQRFLLGAELWHEGHLAGSGAALNDVVIHAAASSKMMDLRLCIDGEFVYTQRSDGLILCTPTGSTAYALSAGGPIMHPTLDAICVVPMFPHTLTSRPLVVPGDSELVIEVLGDVDVRPRVSCDSQVELQATGGDRIRVRKALGALHLLHPLEHSFYESCRSKLDWGSRLGDRRHQ